MYIYKHNWDSMNPFERLKVLRETFKSATASPSNQIISDLIHQRNAYLQLIENRTESSVYLLRQTGVFYLVGQGLNDTVRFYSYLELDKVKPHLKDEPIEFLNYKPLKFTVTHYDSPNCFRSVIIHHESPRFEATSGEQFNYEITKWLDEEPMDENLIFSLKNKLNAFVKSYIK